MERYENDPSFREYVDRYAEKMGISVEVALTHEIVKEREKYE